MEACLVAHDVVPSQPAAPRNAISVIHIRFRFTPVHLLSVSAVILQTLPEAMDKDNKDDFTFAKLSDLKLPVTFRMYAVLEEINTPLV